MWGRAGQGILPARLALKTRGMVPGLYTFCEVYTFFVKYFFCKRVQRELSAFSGRGAIQDREPECSIR